MESNYSYILYQKILSENVVFGNEMLSFVKDMLTVKREIGPSCLENLLAQSSLKISGNKLLPKCAHTSRAFLCKARKWIQNFKHIFNRLPESLLN